MDASLAITVGAYNSVEEGLSLIEKTALRVKPILEEVLKLMVPEKGYDLNQLINNPSKKKKVEADMRIVLGYLNQSELITSLNIGNIMQINPLTLEELLA